MKKSGFNPIDNFPVLKEHLKDGDITERLLMKGFDSVFIRDFCELYLISEWDPYNFSILNRLHRIEQAHIHINYLIC